MNQNTTTDWDDLEKERITLSKGERDVLKKKISQEARKVRQLTSNSFRKNFQTINFGFKKQKKRNVKIKFVV
jgi:hypothetical protein